ncbi:MAG: ABC transporter permease [Oscillospiraceae bacterium]|nr:ABC transporter permease [Oscillospiraceae bacterium]
MYQTILMMEQLAGKSHENSENSENTQSVQNTPLAAKSAVFDGQISGLGMHTGGYSVMSLSQNSMNPENSEITQESQEITESTEVTESTEIKPEFSGVAIADFSILKTPDKTFYTVGEELDLTGGVIHDSVVILNENGEPEILDQYFPMNSEAYTLEPGNYNPTTPGIYPIYLVKNYINTEGKEDSASVMFYVLVSDPNFLPVPGFTDPTEPPAESVTETQEISDTNIADIIDNTNDSDTLDSGSSDPTEPSSEISFTLPSMPSISDILPTMPTIQNPGNSGINSNMSELIQQYLQMQNGMITPNIPSIGTGTGSASGSMGSMSQQDLANLYASMMGGSGMGTAAGSQQDMASMYAAMMGDSSQQDLASMYASMMGGNTGTAAGSGIPGNMSQQDLASMYAAAMQNGQLPSETTSNSNGMSQQDLASMYAAMQNGETPSLSQEDMASMYQQMYSGLSQEDLQKMMSVSSMSETELAASLDEYMKDPDEDILLEIYEQYISSGNYDNNMSTFGLVSVNAPSSISIYVDSFEAKESIADCIADYNETVSEENQISYTDYIGLLMSSVTTIVNVISYVLIAFVAVSLIVSSIMIGIITYISVLERTKEIGILRAIGASKGNISQVFNAETFIIGACSGLIGVGITELLLIPGNIVIHTLAESTAVSAALPPAAAVILIIISIVLTLIGGFIPAKKASAKDAVIALRSE